MPSTVIIDSSLWELQREAMVDIGSGQPAYLTTTTAPIINPIVIGVSENTFVNDVVVNMTHVDHTLTPYTDESDVVVTESVTLLLQDYSAQIFDLEYVSENVVVHRPGTIQTNPITDAVATSEAVTVFSTGANPPSSLFESPVVTENVTTDPVPNPLTNDTSATTEDTTAEITGP